MNSAACGLFPFQKFVPAFAAPGWNASNWIAFL
jgi:hypothetical protein